MKKKKAEQRSPRAELGVLISEHLSGWWRSLKYTAFALKSIIILHSPEMQGRRKINQNLVEHTYLQILSNKVASYQITALVGRVRWLRDISIVEGCFMNSQEIAISMMLIQQYRTSLVFQLSHGAHVRRRVVKIKSHCGKPFKRGNTIYNWYTAICPLRMQ